MKDEMKLGCGLAGGYLGILLINIIVWSVVIYVGVRIVKLAWGG